jgi:hypothetical protein
MRAGVVVYPCALNRSMDVTQLQSNQDFDALEVRGETGRR